MAGRGRAPKPQAQRRSHHKPQRGEWTAAPGEGWQHGPIPEPPDGLSELSRWAWGVWFRGWFAAHWTPGDLPALKVVIGLYDSVTREASSGAMVGELRMWLDTMGISPKGAQDRRWTLAKREVPSTTTPTAAGGVYAHLRAVPEVSA